MLISGGGSDSGGRGRNSVKRNIRHMKGLRTGKCGMIQSRRLYVFRFFFSTFNNPGERGEREGMCLCIPQ